MVIDASVAFKLLINEPDSERAFAAITAGDALAPSLLYAELGNAIWKRIRKGEIVETEVENRLADIAHFLRPIDEIPMVPRALRMAVELGHPIYDCVYLAVAETLDDIVLTADAKFAKRLAGTAYAERVRLL